MAIDANLELAEEDHKFDVFGYMKKLRQSRKNLVENVVSEWVYEIQIKVRIRHSKMSASETEGIMFFSHTKYCFLIVDLLCRTSTNSSMTV